MSNPALIGLAGYPATTVAGLARAIKATYLAADAIEGVNSPTIQFGRRHVEQIHAPPRIVMVPRRGTWGNMQEIAPSSISGVAITLQVFIWGPEPTLGDDEFENELARWDLADPLRNRFIATLAQVAPGRYEALDIDPDAGKGEGNAASVNEYGETYVLTFRFFEAVARDGHVAQVEPDKIHAPAPLYKDPLPTDVGANITVIPEQG